LNGPLIWECTSRPQIGLRLASYPFGFVALGISKVVANEYPTTYIMISGLWTMKHKQKLLLELLLSVSSGWKSNTSSTKRMRGTRKFEN